MRYISILLLTACAQYPEPDTDQYFIKFKMVEDASIECDAPACAVLSNICTVVLSVKDWENYATHELSHCFEEK